MTQYIQKLPAVFQTTTEKKFFDATFDQVFSKKDSDYLSGFIGRRDPGLYDPINDFYLPEPNKDRTWWQLEATTFARNTDGTKTNILFYDDLLNRINYYGGNTLNQDRLFESEYYSWAPPIDYDMFMNYYNYYWVDHGLTTITIVGISDVDVSTLIIGKPAFNITQVPGARVKRPWLYPEDWASNPSFNPDDYDLLSLQFTTGIKVQFEGSINYPSAMTVENMGGTSGIQFIPIYVDYMPGSTFEFIPWDGAIHLANGRTITDTDWDIITWDTEPQPGNADYITIERGCIDRNAWSRTNSWYHIDAITSTINATGITFPVTASRALRPIIQFSADLVLYKSGTQFKTNIQFGFRDDKRGTPLKLLDFQGELRHTINTQLGIELTNGQLVVFMNDSGPMYEFEPWDGYILNDKWDILPWVVSPNDPTFIVNQHIFAVQINADTDMVSFVPFSTIVENGDITFATEDAPFDGAQRGETWYYENGVWLHAVNDKVGVNQPPLFQLYDHNHIALDDVITYPESTFAGNKIFSYKLNTTPGASVDPVLKFPIVYTSLGQSSDIIFQNNVLTDRYVYGAARLPITGYYYYTFKNSTEYFNNWNLYTPVDLPESSKQRVTDRYVLGYGTEYLFKLSTLPVGYPDAPDIIVTVDGTEVKPLAESSAGYNIIVRNNELYVNLELYIKNLLTTTPSVAPTIEIYTYTHDKLNPAAVGYFEIPQQLEANPTQEEIDYISASDLFNQFSSIIQHQIGITGSPFGGRNNYRDTLKNRTVGSYILQNVTPAIKSMLFSSDSNLDIISAIRFSEQEYTKFKNKYLQTALRLINQEFNPVQYHNNSVVISAWVDEIIKTINVSKEFSHAFAYSYMIANGTPYSTEEHIVPVGGAITLTNYLDLNNPKSALYVYDITGQEQLLVIGVDYEIVSTNLAIDLQFSDTLVGRKMYIALYTNPVPGYIPAYVPSTPTKIGAYPTYMPRMELDTSYTIPTYVIIGHDGSKTIAYGDYRDQLLLELEKRIYNLLQYKFRNEYTPPIRLENVKPGFFRQTRYSFNEFLDITESYLNKWSAFNRANYHANDWISASEALPINSPELWKLYNYSDAVKQTGGKLNLPGNWKGIYQYCYDTIFPNTRPWEMLGFSMQPTWWEDQYGTDWTPSNTALWADLELGIIRQGPSAVFDPATLQPQPQKMWARPGLSTMIPVDMSGNIVPIPTLFNLSMTTNPYAPFDGFDKEWIYGDGAPVEQAWMSTTDYTFSIQEFLYLMNPAKYSEYIFDTIGTELSPGTLNPGWVTSLGYFEPGSFYDDGIYNNVIMTGGTGIGTICDIVVSNGMVTDVKLVIPGVGYTAGDILTVYNNVLGMNGNGFNVLVKTVTCYPVKSNINWQYVQNDVYASTDPYFEWMRPKNKDQIVHAESIDNEIQIRYGYQRWVSDKILFLGKDITTTFGDKVRTLDINLANKFAGFTNKDTVSTYIESITPGSTTTSLLIPTNNFQVMLHTGQPIKTYAYSGVIIRVTEEGKFAVYGYDLLNSEFTVINRSDEKLIDITIGGTPAPFKIYEYGETYYSGDIVRYNGVYYTCLGLKPSANTNKFDSYNWQKLRALPTTGGVSVIYRPLSLQTMYTIPYGTILDTPQDVFDFLIGWGAYLESQGWEFTDVSIDTSQVSDWLYSAKQYLFWLNTNWAANSSIQLSPAANKAMLTVKNGYPNDVETISNGVYSILDKYGIAMPPSSTVTDRNGMFISVSPVDLAAGGIYFLQVNASETEHILMFDNRTSFNDIIYDPLLRQRQQRLRFNGFRSNGWYGKAEAPGYLIVNNDLVPNFDSIVNAMNYYYDPNVMLDNPSLERLGQHLIGYESKSYLDNLQVSNDVQYLFYTGAIRQKGTKQAFDKLFRSTKVQSNEVIEVYEEWALKLSNFGNTVEQVKTEFILQPEQNSGEVIVSRLNFKPSHIGFVKEIRILNAENKYLNVPRIVISAPDADPNDPELFYTYDKFDTGAYDISMWDNTVLVEPLRQAKAYAILDNNGVISRIDITDKGFGYLRAPCITIDSGAEINNLDELYSVWQGQIIRDTLSENIIDIDIDDTAKWISRPQDPQYSLEFPETEIVDYNIPNAGYVNFDDVTWTSFNTRQTAVNWGTESFNPKQNDTVWIANTFTEDWDVYKMVNIRENPYDANPWKVIDHSGSLLLLTNHTTTSSLGVFEPTAALATSVITKGGVVVGAKIINGGTGYSTAPLIDVDGQCQTYAMITATISNNVVVGAVVVYGGLGYESAPELEVIGDCTEKAKLRAIVKDGSITEIEVVYGGSGYLIQPSIKVEEPLLTTAIVHATAYGGKVTGLTIINGGAGYVSAPTLTVSSPIVEPIILTVGVVDGVVTTVDVISQGLGYSSIPTVTVTGPCIQPATLSLSITNGILSNVIITNGGTGYTSVPTVTVGAPVVSVATATATITNGVVTSVTIVDGGAGYSVTPSVYVSAQVYEAATLAPVVADGVVTSLNIENGGSGYVSPPTLNVIGICSTPAVLQSVIADGVVTSVNLINGGGLYTVPPDVSVVGACATRAQIKSIIEYGVIVGFDIIDGGSGYESPPELDIEQPATTFVGKGAALYPVVNNDGEITDVVILNGGTGYSTADRVVPLRAINNIPGLVDAKLRITKVGEEGEILSVEIQTPGKGYQPVPNQELYPQLSNSVNGRTDFGNMICLQIRDRDLVAPSTNYAICFTPDGLYTDPRSLVTYNSYRLVTLDGNPITSNNIGVYAQFTDLLLFKSMRFQTKPIEPNLPKYVGIGDLIWIDDVDAKWSVYRITGTGGHSDISYFDPVIEEDWGAPMQYNYGWDITPPYTFELFRQQEKLINTKLFESASVFQTGTADELVLLPVYDPFKGIFPAMALQNISYMLLQDPARYNITGNSRLYTDNITFGEAQVGKLWWDMSTMRYAYYEQPLALDSSESNTYNLEYRRDRWGQLFPGSSIDIYEWTKSDVPPSEYTGSGTPRSTTDWVQIHTSNRFTNITTTNYYFWVLRPRTKPNLENRTMTALDVARLLYTPRSQGFVFFSPIQQTNINNSYMYYNVQEILAYKGDNVQVQYRLAEREDQPHAQWKLFREGDTASLIDGQFWNKMVDSICGYTKMLPPSDEWNNSIFIGKDLPWDVYGSDVALWDTATSTTTSTYGEILTVPDPTLSESEKYGITYRPLQGMFVDVYYARKIFVQSANNLLKHIPIKDTTPDWNINVSSDMYWDYTTWYEVGFEDATPSVVFSTLALAQQILSEGKLTTGTIVEVIQGTSDGRYVLYNVVQLDPNNSAQSFQKIGVEKSAIRLLDTVYTTHNVYGLSVELRELLDAFRTKVFINSYVVYQNELFFSMLNYVLSEQRNPNWLFKTSYIYIKENNIPLTQSRLYQPNQIENIMGYIRDSKPYHTQIRDYTSTYTVSDLAVGTASTKLKSKEILQFGPDYGGPYENGLWDVGCEIPGDPSYWESNSWDVCPTNYELIVDPFTTDTWETMPSSSEILDLWDEFWWDTSLVNQFISRSVNPENSFKDVYAIPLTTFDSTKVGYSVVKSDNPADPLAPVDPFNPDAPPVHVKPNIFPYTFNLNTITFNNPQTFIAPKAVVSVKVGENVFFYGKDYYVTYNADTQDYTVFLFHDPGTENIAAMILLNGGGMQPFRYGTNRTEIGYGFPKVDLVMNIDTRLPVNEVNGVYYPLNNMWDSEGTAVDAIIGTTSAGFDMLPWDQNNFENIVYLDNTISYKENKNIDVGPRFYRNALAFSGTLKNTLPAPTAETTNLNTVIVFVDPAIHGSFTDILPDPGPGPRACAVWIDGERIEYETKVDLGHNTWELGKIRRGTMGTAPVEHLSSVPSLNDPDIPVPTPVWVEQDNILDYREEWANLDAGYDTQPFDTVLWDQEIYIGGKYDIVGADTTGWDNGTYITTEKYLVSVDTTVWNALNPLPDPASGINGFDQAPWDSTAWEISGMYTSVTSAVSLWYATTPEAMFLKAQPGIAIPEII